MQQDSKQITLVNEGAFDRRIDVLKILREFGLSLCESHKAINELAGTGQAICCFSAGQDFLELQKRLLAFQIATKFPSQH